FLLVATILILSVAHIYSTQSQGSNQAQRNSSNQSSTPKKPKTYGARAKHSNNSTTTTPSSTATHSSSTASNTQQSGSATESTAPQANTSSSGAAARAADFFNQGQEHYRARAYREAVAAYKKAINLEPNDARTHYELG